MSTIFCSCEKEVHVLTYLIYFHHHVIPTLLPNITVLTVQFGDKEKHQIAKKLLAFDAQSETIFKSTFCTSKAKI